MQPLGHLPNSNSTWGDVSNDGTVVGGTSRQVTSTGIVRSEAFRWTEEGGMVGLGFLPGTSYTDAWAISGDGSTLVGLNQLTSGHQAFRWTEQTGVESLGEIDGLEDSAAADVTNDGSLIVGHAANGLGDQPFVWTLETGMLSLTEVLKVQFGLEDELFGWSLGRATTVSDNGRYIAGYGTWFNSSRAWLIDRGANPEPFQVPFQPVPEPSMYGILGALGLGILTLRRRWSRRGAA